MIENRFIKKTSHVLAGIVASAVLKTGLWKHYSNFCDKYALRKLPFGTLSFPYFIKRNDRSYQILVYHRINDDHDPYFGGMPIKLFYQQMELLKQKFNVFPLEDLFVLSRSNDIPQNAIAITFDDGYKDNYENAFPILKHFNLPATIFLTTGSIDTSVPLWHDRVFSVFRNRRSGTFRFRDTNYRLDTDSESLVVLNVVLNALRRISPQKRDVEINKIVQSLGVSDEIDNSYRKLTWSDVIAMAGNGISFGAHTVNHPILTEISSEEAKWEILRSKETIERKLSIRVSSFAYPNGSPKDYSNEIKGIIADCGFDFAVTTNWGVNDRKTDPYLLRRIGLWGIDPIKSIFRLPYYKFLSDTVQILKV